MLVIPTAPWAHALFDMLAWAASALTGAALHRWRLRDGIVIWRWGCLFAGLSDRTYGVPTSLPWAVDLGDVIGRHPFEIYESLAMLAFLLVYLIALVRRRR